MKRFALLLLAASAGYAAGPALADRVGSTGFVQLEAESFKSLSPREQALAFYLSRAAIAIDPIIYDQLSRFGLRQKRLLEAIVARPDAPPKIVAFTKLFWANRGNRHATTAQKFLPEFTFEELKAAALAALRAKALRFASEQDLTRELDELRPSLFDPAFEPAVTAKSPRGNLDILQASANNFYSAVTMADLRNFQERYPLNSRVVKRQGKLVEEVYRAGTPDGRVKPGLYARVPGQGDRVPLARPQLRRARAAKGLRRADPLLPDRRARRLAGLRRALGSEQPDGGFHQRLH